MSNRTLLLLAAVCLTGSNVLAVDASPFVGKWKLNAAKSVLAGFRTKIEDAGNHEFKFTTGDDVETLIIDGQEHPIRWGGTRIITEVAPNHWKSVYKRDGKIISTDEWSVSNDGQELYYMTAGTKPDGSTFKNEFKNKRVAGTSGQVGTWESTEVDPASYPDFVIEPLEGGGLARVVPSYQSRRLLKFDGKDYPNEGPQASPGATTASKRIDERTIEITDKLKDQIMDTRRLEVSADGKTLTDTFTFPGVEKKEVDVYGRQ